MTLRLLADENISPRVVSFLRQSGIDVLDVKEENWHGTEDHLLLERAHSDKRFILTLDSDFGTLAINQGRPFWGIIYLRLKNLRNESCIRVLKNLISHEIDPQPGMILVLDESRIRIRIR
jgi:predicted nuclease of predicted toxin-antitoxin system